MKALLKIAVISFVFLGKHALSQENFFNRLADSALTLTYQQVVYDPSYFSISYPDGDIPAGRGVCSDVIIRTYRKLNHDLQQAVHEDMTSHFASYPNNWGLNTTDPNIDHRRVPNLMTYFKRNGESLPITQNATDYRPGDIVCWELQRGIPHIGFVANKKASNTKRPLIIHNIGAGQVAEDCLFDFRIIGHFRYQP